MGWKARKWSAHAAIGVLFDGGMRSDGDGIPRIYGGGEVPRCRAEQSVTSRRSVCFLLFQCATVNLISFVKREEGKKGWSSPMLPVIRRGRDIGYCHTLVRGNAE